MAVKLIWAQSVDGVIGDGTGMPWHLPEDLRFFRQQTMGAPVLMGRCTWDSLSEKYRPLPGRDNFIASSCAPGEWSQGATVISDVTAFLDHAVHTSALPPLWVVGGGQLYSTAIDYADEIIVTVIDGALREVLGETAVYAPTIDTTVFTGIRTEHFTSARGSTQGLRANAHEPLSYTITWYRRSSPSAARAIGSTRRRSSRELAGSGAGF